MAAALAMALVAVLVRLPHLGWGLPDIEEEALPLKKAFAMWGWQDGRPHLDPQTAGWPSLSFYVHFLLQHLVYWYGRLSGSFADRLDFYMLQRDFTPLVLAGRALGVAAAGVVVGAAVRLGERLVRPLAGSAWGLFAGLLAGASLAVSPLLYVESRLITPDILLAALAALAVVRLVDIGDRGRVRDYVWAGVWIGLGASAKYSPILLAPALYAAHLLRRRAETGAATPAERGSTAVKHTALGRLGLGDRRLWWAALACVLAFALTSPYVILDLDVFKRDFSTQVSHLGGGHFGHETRGGLSLYYLRDVLAPAFGWPGLFLAMAGLAWAATRLRGAWITAAASAVFLYLGLGFLSTKFDRYMLPLLLPLALGLAAWVIPIAARRRVVALGAASLLAAVVLVPPAVTTLQHARSQALPSTQQRARQYILDELAAPDLVFAMEAYTPELPLDRQAELGADEAFARLSPARRTELLGDRTFDVVYMPLYSVDAELAAFYYDLRHFLPADVIVTSQGVRGRFERFPARFARQMAFYRDLERYTQHLRTFTPGDEARGPEIRIYRFTPDGRERLLRDRGELTPGFYHAFQPLHAPHFHAFIGSMAWRAYSKQMYGLADLYYQALQETTPPEPLRIFQSPHVVTRLELGMIDEARRMCEDALQRDPDDPQALALLGLALEIEGDIDRAIAMYERSIAAAGAARAGGAAPESGAFFDAAEWAGRKLASLRAQIDE